MELKLIVPLFVVLIVTACYQARAGGHRRPCLTTTPANHFLEETDMNRKKKIELKI